MEDTDEDAVWLWELLDDPDNTSPLIVTTSTCPVPDSTTARRETTVPALMFVDSRENGAEKG